MALTKTERETIENVVKRMKKPRLGCAEPFSDTERQLEHQAPGYEGVARIYLETWIIPALELLLSDDPQHKRTALEISR